MNMKNGFSTLNRLLGKKSKANGSFNGNLSKSTTNLSLSTSTTNINEASQMQYNRITPLPVATSNAPFEQTFRITVLLPKEQLYVARLGARVPLQKLLELVCENKQLDPEKYEFRHPVDSSQVFNCALTIGAVGLSEIRLCNKSESYDSFNADDIIKLHRTSIIRDSLSSSEFSSRNSKQTAKTASPYSSSNSLNSMDSTGMNYNRTPVQVPQTAKYISPAQAAVNVQPPIAPTRKKRMAPKPPSHKSIPEKSPLIMTVTTNGGYNDVKDKKIDAARQPLPRKDFHVSSPNLYRTASTELSLSVAATANGRNDIESIVDCNGNTETKRDNHNGVNGKHENGLNKSPPAPRTRPLSVHVFNQQDQMTNHQYQSGSNNNSSNNNNNNSNNIQQMTSRNPLEEKNNVRNMYSGSVQNLSTFDENKFPEPSPRKHILLVKKKVAPSPPPRTISATAAELAAAAGQVDSTNSQSSLRWRPMSSVDDGEKSSEMQSSSITSLVEQESHPPATEWLTPTPIEIAMQQTRNPLPIQDDSRVLEEEAIAAEASTSPIDELKLNQNQAKTPPVPVALPRVSPQTVEATAVETAAFDHHHRTISSNNNNNNNSSTTNKNNVSKVLLNRTLTPEPPSPPLPPPNPAADERIVEIVETEIEIDRSLSPSDAIAVATSVANNTNITDVNIYHTHSDDNLSKQADSGIGEPIPSPIPEESLTSENSTAECKSSFESGSSSSSDDDELIKVYNLKLGKTIIKSMSEHKSLEDLPIAVAIEEEEEEQAKVIPMNGNGNGNGNSSNSGPTSPSPWNYTIPAPPNFADTEREKNQATSLEEKEEEEEEEEVRKTIAPPSTLITTSVMVAAKVVDELNAIINENRIDSIIRKSEDSGQIESAKPNTLKNFTINAIAIGQATTQPNGFERKTSTNEGDDNGDDEDEKLFRKRGNLLLATNGLFKHRKSITRSDSFHSTCLTDVTATSATAATNGGCDIGVGSGGVGLFHNSNGLNSRSSSYISLAKHEMSSISGATGAIVSNSRRSSSELSIGESPSLQSLLVMKSILNSRKNSLNNGDSGHIVQSNGCNDSDKQPIADRCEEQQKSSPPPAAAAAPQPPPKVYRYSGPPSINFSTWSERPKGQISIKNEGDYIFGGGNNGSPNAVTTAALNFTTTSRNGSGRNSSMSSPTTESVPTRILPFVRSVEYKKNAGVVNPTSIPTMKRFSMGATLAAPPQTEMESGDLQKPITNKFILGRLGGNLAKPPSMENGGCGIVPSVRGFRNTGDFSLPQQPHPQQQQQQIEVTPQTNGHHFLSGNFEQQTSNQQQLPNGNGIEPKTSQSKLPRSNRFSMITPGPVGASLLRSTSITQYDAKSKKSTSTDAVPFSQLQLRKTGLKEKILAKSCGGDDGDDSAAAPSSASAKESSASVQESAIKAVHPEHLDSAKKEQKSSSIKIVSPVASPPPTPPAPPIIRAVLAKQNSNGMPSGPSLPSPPPDTREQLLAAIRNFKRTDLHRA